MFSERRSRFKTGGDSLDAGPLWTLFLIFMYVNKEKRFRQGVYLRTETDFFNVSERVPGKVIQSLRL